jgi:hypothetical protein
VVSLALVMVLCMSKYSDISLSDRLEGCQSPSGTGTFALSVLGSCPLELCFKCVAPSEDNSPCKIRRKYLTNVDIRVLPYRGELCSGCSWGHYSFEVAVPFTSPIWLGKSRIPDYKARRFMVRAFRGVMCGLAKGYRFRWFVLTESDEALSLGLDFGREFNRFLTWLRYWCSDFQYIVVEHKQGEVSKVTAQQRRNWHILSYGSDKLPVDKIREYWKSHFLSTVTGMAEVHRIDKAIVYMAGYLSGTEKFVRSWSSQGWVYRGWVGDSTRYKVRFGSYPEADMLKLLSLMSPLRRADARLCLAETGFISLEGCYHE